MTLIFWRENVCYSWPKHVYDSPRVCKESYGLTFYAEFFKASMWGKKNTALSLFDLEFFNRFKVYSHVRAVQPYLCPLFFNHFRVKNTFSLFKSRSLFILKRVFIKVLKLFECISNHCRTCSYCGFHSFSHRESSSIYLNHVTKRSCKMETV